MPPTEQVAERLASQVFRTELSPETRQRLGAGHPLGLRCVLGRALGADSGDASAAGRCTYGVALGLAVWLVGPMRLVPALGLYERPASSGLVRRVLAIALHLLYGLTTAFTYQQVTRGQ